MSETLLLKLANQGIPQQALELGQKIEPLFKRVVIWPCDIQFTDQASLLYRPETSEDAPETGVIIAVAADVERVVPGDVVLFGRYSGYGIADNKLVACREDDVMHRLHGVTIKPRDPDAHPLRGQLVSG